MVLLLFLIVLIVFISLLLFDSSNNKVVIAYQDGGNSSHGYGIVGTVSGTSISFGWVKVVSEHFETHEKYHNYCCFDL